MLVIKTRLREIKGKGIGLVADQEIAQGESTWTFNSVIDIRIPKNAVPIHAKNFLDTYSVDQGTDTLFLCIDNARFTNHSDNPNTRSLGIDKDNVATRDIHVGEEITIDYNEIDIHGVDFLVE